MKRVALVCSEPIRETMAGIGVRYLEIARRLPAADLDVVLITPGAPEAVPRRPDDAFDVRRLRPASLRADLADRDVVVVQGGHGDRVLRSIGDTPAVVDLYDPWLVENLHYVDELGSTAYERDHASWTLQLSRGDFFLCASEAQRCFYLGWLAAAGRLSPDAIRDDPALADLIGLVPFGIPESLPPHRPVLPSGARTGRRILFGGLYDWLDPWPALLAMELLDEATWQLLLVRNPNPETTPQRRWQEVERWCRERGWWGGRVRPIDWVPADRRFDLLRDVDALVVTHRDGPETWLSLRTRVLDALAAGCPVVISDGGATADLLRRHDLGEIVPPDDPNAIAAALGRISGPGTTAETPARPATRRAGAPDDGRAKLIATLGWARALEPLARFCRDPRRHPTRRDPGSRGRIVGTLRDLVSPARPGEPPRPKAGG